MQIICQNFCSCSCDCSYYSSRNLWFFHFRNSLWGKLSTVYSLLLKFYQAKASRSLLVLLFFCFYSVAFVSTILNLFLVLFDTTPYEFFSHTSGEALNIDPREFYRMLYLSLLQIHAGKSWENWVTSQFVGEVHIMEHCQVCSNYAPEVVGTFRVPAECSESITREHNPSFVSALIKNKLSAW